MSWLTPLLGILGIIGLIVLIIIYIIKPNYQNKIISSTFVWKLSLKYKKNKIPLNKLRSILLFLCQVLIIATAALILAQPFIASDKVESQRKVLIIDASVSMLAETGDSNRFAKAVEEVRKETLDLLENENAEVYKQYCNKIGYNPNDCIFVDDSYSNHQYAKEIGMTTIRVYYKNNSAKDMDFIDSAYKGFDETVNGLKEDYNC